MSVTDPRMSTSLVGTGRHDAVPDFARGNVSSVYAIGRLKPVMVCVFALMLVLQVTLIFGKLGGHFSYTLDDPYIHLALADQIARGHYGLDPAVAASPSSSILYPFLLAGLSFTGVGQFAPLLVAMAATLASAVLLASLIADIFPNARLRILPMIVLASSLALGLNLIGLALTGMEHSLQVAVTLGWALGTRRFLRNGTLDRWWGLCALAEPLLRYEGAVLWLATVILLLYHRHRMAGLTLLMAGVAALGAFTAFLHSLGLPPLPSSVLVKTHLTATGSIMPQLGMLDRLLYTITTNIAAPNAGLLVATTLGLVLLVERKRRGPDRQDRETLQLAAVAITASVAQFAFGRVDPYSRYTIHLLALHVVVLAAGFAPEIELFAQRASWRIWAAIFCVALALPLYDYAERSVRSDLGASNIYEQQYQMHRMATDFYRAPVAVNDLGWVSYRNPYPVLDLWGLGSEEARLARSGDPTSRWMDELTRRHHAGLAMIYDRWFPSRPSTWRPLAYLRLGSRLVTAADRTVTFYATTPEDVPAIEAALDGLAASLPPGVTIERVGPDRASASP